MDLISHGMRLRWLGDGTDRVTWRDIFVVLRHSGTDSALVRFEHPEESAWSVTDHLLANVIDLLNLRLWQESGGKARRPDPIPRPNDRPEPTKLNPQTGEGGVFKGESLSVEDMRAWLDSRK